MLLILYQILGHAHQEEQNRNYRKCSSYKTNMRDSSLVSHNPTKEAAGAVTEIKDTGIYRDCNRRGLFIRTADRL